MEKICFLAFLGLGLGAAAVASNDCKDNTAYHNVEMVDDVDREVANPKECLEKCNNDDSCFFWDFHFSSARCRLRKEWTGADGPEQDDNEYTAGSKNCIFEWCAKLYDNHGYDKRLQVELWWSLGS